MLPALAFSLADIRLTSILIIPDITKIEYNILTPKTREVYPNKRNTYGMGSKKWIIIICVAPDNIHTNKSRNYGRKKSLKKGQLYETLQKGYRWVRFVHECLGEKEGRNSENFLWKEVCFSGTHIEAKFTSFIESTSNYASKKWPLKA